MLGACSPSIAKVDMLARCPCLVLQLHPVNRPMSRDAKKEFEAVTQKVFCDEKLYKDAGKKWWDEYWVSLTSRSLDREADVDWISLTSRSPDREAAVDMIEADVDMIDENDL